MDVRNSRKGDVLGNRTLSMDDGYGIGTGGPRGSQSIGGQQVDPTGGGEAKGSLSPPASTGVTTGPGFGTPTSGLTGVDDAPGDNNDSPGDNVGTGDNEGFSEGDSSDSYSDGYNLGGLAGKKKKKLKVKRMKRGGLASR